jgi:hypothetical protein
MLLFRLAIMCQGTAQEKLQYYFKSYDLDKKWVIMKHCFLLGPRELALH